MGGTDAEDLWSYAYESMEYCDASYADFLRCLQLAIKAGLVERNEEGTQFRLTDEGCMLGEYRR